jgi:hypothetical protein
MQLKNLVVAVIGSSSLLGISVQGATVFAGDESPLRKSLVHATVVEKAVYTNGNVAAMIRVFPEPIDFRLEDAPPGQVPWRPAWLSGWQFTRDMNKSEVEIIRRSDLTLVVREQDGKTCVVNELSGARIFTETAEQQDKTAVELPCAKIWDSFETLAGFTASDRKEITALLETPPPPPSFRRRPMKK